MSAHSRMSLSSGRVPPAETRQTFPILPYADVLAALADMSVTGLREKDLTEPKADVVAKIYEHMVEHCMQKTKEELSQPHFSALDAIKWPELHDESLPRANSYLSVKRLLQVCDVPDFTLSDLHRPNPKRLLRHLSAIINFAKYRVEQLDIIDQFTGELEEVQQRHEAALVMREALEAKLTDLKARREAELPAIRSAEATVEGLRQRIAELNKVQAILRHETAEDKAAMHTLKEDLSAKAVLLAELRDACDKENALIVQSPDRMKQELRHLSSQLSEEDSATGEVEGSRRDMRVRLEGLAKAGAACDKLTQLLGEVVREQGGRKEAKGVARSLAERVQAHTDALADAEAKKRSLEKALQRVGEKLSDFRPAAESKIAASRKALTAAKAELSRVLAENSQLDAARGVAVARRDDILSKRDEERRRHRDIVNEMTSSYARLTSRVHAYHERLRLAMAQADVTA